MEDLGRIVLRPGPVAGPVQGPGSRFWSGHRVLTGSPDRPGQLFFFKSKRRRFSKKTKKIKVNGFATGFWSGFTGLARSHRIFFSLVFFQSGPVPAPDRSGPRSTYRTGSSFKTMLVGSNLLFSWAKTLFVLVLYQSIRCTLLLFYVIVNF
jgi:hypothetical protein